MSRPGFLLLTLLPVWLLMSSPLTLADSGESFSAANNALFFENHLANLLPDKEQTLVYEVEQTGSGDDVSWFKDTVTLQLKPTTVQHREATIEYLTGEHNRWVPPLTDPTGNPVLMLFLQSDVQEMGRINGGHWRHFQKYIKLALENGAKLEDIHFEYDGKTRQGRKITIQPYLDDPEKGKYQNKAYLQKRYDFILSSEVPGGLYQISAVVPAEIASEDKPVFSWQLSLRNPAP